MHAYTVIFITVRISHYPLILTDKGDYLCSYFLFRYLWGLWF